jgi:hypothetical protein
VQGIVNNVAPGASTWASAAGRVFTAAASRVVRLYGGEIIIGTSVAANPVPGSLTNNTYPALQGANGTPLVPPIFSGERAANLDGFFGQAIDWWVAYTSSVAQPAIGDFLPGYEPGDTVGVTAQRSNWLVSVGGAFVRPWRNAAITLETI